MSRLRANQITNRMANGAPTVSDGLVISGVTTSTSFKGDGSQLTGISATNITVADESTDTTCFPLYATAASGSLAPKTGSNLAFNSSSGNLRTTSLFLGTGSNESKAQDGLIIERNSGDGLIHISAGRSTGNYGGFNFYVAGDTGGANSNIKLRHQMIYDGSFRWYDSDGTTERLRITSDGRILFNSTSTTNTDDFLTIKRPAGGHSAISMTVDATTATGSYANAFINTKSKGYYYNGLVFSSSEKHEGGIVGRTTGSGSNDPSIEVRVGGTGINASDTLAMNINHSGYVTKPAHPSFHARLINHTNATANPLVFDDVIVNVGSHYKSSGSDAGKFVVPIAGTYFFFWEAIKNSTTSVTRLYLQKNGSRTYNNMHLRLQEEGLYANGCINAIMTLAVGDKIHIELAIGGVHAAEYTHFGGYLIG